MPEVITGWVELIDASLITDTTNISEILCQLGEDNVNLENGCVVCNEDDTTIVSHEIICYEDSPPDFEQLFQPIVHYLQSGEFLLYSAKFRFCFREHCLAMYLITGQGVHACDSSIMTNGLARFMPHESDDFADREKEDAEL